MSSVVTIRVPLELRERMRRVQVNWSVEVRNFIERRLRELELAELIEQVEVRAKARKTQVDSAKLLREDRESR